MIVEKLLSVLLKDLDSGARPKGGVSGVSGEIPSLGAEHLDSHGGFSFHKTKYISKDFFSQLKKGRIEKGNILIVKDGATTGKVSFVGNDFPFEKAAVNEHVFRLDIDISVAYPKYIFYYLLSNKGKTEILKDFRGATVGGISRSFCEKVKIPLPTLEEQKRIAAILDKADALRRKRQQAIDLSNQFLRSVFLDMFGDPVTNPKGWKTAKVGTYTECIVPGRDKPKSFTGNIPWVTTNDLKHLHYTNEPQKFIGLSEEEVAQVRARIIPKDSVLMTCVGDLGVISIAQNEMVINQQLHSFQCFDGINNIFLMFCLSFQKHFMLKMASNTTVPYMNKTICNSVPIIIPKIEKQGKFSNIYARTHLLKHRLTESNNNNELFNSLSQKAFKGEL